jgi:hypothetical protein
MISESLYDRAKKISFEGGLRIDEITEFDDEELDVEYAQVDLKQVSYHQIPYAAAYCQRNGWENSENFRGPEELLNYLTTAGLNRSDFDRMLKDEKKQEFFLRTFYTLGEDLGQESIESSIEWFIDGSGRDAKDQRNAMTVLANYLGSVDEIVEGSNLMNSVHDEVLNYRRSRVMAQANISGLNLVVEENHQGRYNHSKELNDEGVIKTRLRNMKGAGQCEFLESNHYDTLIDESSHKYQQTTIIGVDGDIAGALKNVGNRSMVALQDFRHEGRSLLRKGWAYRISVNNLNQEVRPPSLAEGWNTLEVDRLEVRPLRPLGTRSDITMKEFDEKIEEKLHQLQSLDLL